MADKLKQSWSQEIPGPVANAFIDFLKELQASVARLGGRLIDVKEIAAKARLAEAQAGLRAARIRSSKDVS